MPYSAEISDSQHKRPLGALRRIATNQELDYQPFELSSSTLGIISRDTLSTLDYLVLEHPEQRIPLRVMSPPQDSEAFPGLASSQRYRLICLDPDLQLDTLILRSQSQGQGPHPTLALQYARFVLQPKLYVEAWHPISQAMAMFEALNISRSGILLRSNGPGFQIEPYICRGEMELKLDVARLWLPQVIKAKCQIVRVYTERQGNQLHTCLGVQFMHFDPSAARMWHELLTRLEKNETPGSFCVRPAGFSQK